MPSDTTLSDVRVLLVDDHAGMLARTASVLARECTVVGTATDGATALDAATKLQPDVIVLDISMPGMNGFEVAARLRAAGSRAAVVFLSAYDDEEFMAAALAAGAAGYVLKQCLSSQLMGAVRSAGATGALTPPRRCDPGNS